MSNFVQAMGPYAARASKALGISGNLILTQWAIESGNGTSNLAVKYHNYGGIRPGAGSPAVGKTDSNFAIYKSTDDFVTDYIRVMKLGYYKNVLAAESPADQLAALVKSPYDAGHYGGNGATLLARAKTLGLSLSGGGSGQSAVQVASGNNSKANALAADAESGLKSAAAQVSALSDEDMKKYAGIGLLVCAVIVAVKN